MPRPWKSAKNADFHRRLEKSRHKGEPGHPSNLANLDTHHAYPSYLTLQNLDTHQENLEENLEESLDTHHAYPSSLILLPYLIFVYFSEPCRQGAAVRD